MIETQEEVKMALTQTHIKNIDLFLNCKEFLSVKTTDQNGKTLSFDTRSQFLDHIMQTEGVKHSKQSLTGMLTYRILTDKPFFGYTVELSKSSTTANQKGNLGKSFTQGRFKTCLLGDKTDGCAGKKIKRHRKEFYLIDAENKAVITFDNYIKYCEYADEKGLIKTVKRSKIKGYKKVGENFYLVTNKRYLNEKLMNTYYYITQKGKFIGGCSSFDELCSHFKITAASKNKLRAAIGGKSEYKGKRIQLRRTLNVEGLQ